MSAFQERLEQAFRHPAKRRAEPHWSRAVLEDLASWITRESGGLVYGRVASTGVPEGTMLVWGPITRLGDTATLLVVSGHGDRAMRHGTGQRLMFSRDELERDILELVASDAFRDALDEMRRRASEPTEGFLRSGDPHDRDPAHDVFVEVPPDHQKRLAEALLHRDLPAEVSGIRVRLAGPSPIAKGVYEERKSALRWLVAGGVVVEISPPMKADHSTVEFAGVVQRDA
ncbi:hypothetical protein [Sorangium sp. So ce513]|uniref:hypothetical protein n=1 Tax=Sorangium sp. So ce513 TaxID=3133315 RepID=UPI003F616D70